MGRNCLQRHQGEGRYIESAIDFGIHLRESHRPTSHHGSKSTPYIPKHHRTSGWSWDLAGVEKFLHHLNPHKATGPDEVSFKVLKETSHQLATAMTLLFQASTDQGKLNYWSLSFTSVCSKVLEHKVHSHITCIRHLTGC